MHYHLQPENARLELDPELELPETTRLLFQCMDLPLYGSHTGLIVLEECISYSLTVSLACAESLGSSPSLHFTGYNGGELYVSIIIKYSTIS
jgi:hypothetical protein